MKVEGNSYRTLWVDHSSTEVLIIDQTQLPHRFEIVALRSLEDVCHAIITMQVRGAPLIGASAAYGLALALQHDASRTSRQQASEKLMATRPTAINLKWALDRVNRQLNSLPEADWAEFAWREAARICEEDVIACKMIGEQGASILEDIYRQKQTEGPLNILTHCNAGWLATLDWGTALAPIYRARERSIPLHIWVDETRPRNQGASLTAWELMHEGIDHTLICDNTGGHLMQHGMVDLCLVGSDRTTAQGDVCNKIGTYLKALAAYDNNVPFYVALPVSTIDWTLQDGVRDIPIELRDASEITQVRGICNAELQQVRITPESTPAANYAFDVTPARLVTGLITEKGLFKADQSDLIRLRQTVQDESDD